MKIENYLVLNKYLLSLFGIDDFTVFQEKFKDTPTGNDSNGRTHFVNILISSLSGLSISDDDLLRYDENIKSYIKKINYQRDKIELKYFQYLSIIFTEIFLDKLKNDKVNFLKCINEFISKYQRSGKLNIDFILTENDLKKLAYWMATGSGKTLIMHINYHQFLKYKLFNPDNIILITPNEGLSKQHYEELLKSGIPARLYQGSLNSSQKGENEILVIEMTKFVEEKKGGGVTMPVDAFEGKNLVFVDEGHKGRSSEEQKWAKLRNKISENGFVFEYSATFGQILSENNPEILKEYAKSIIYNYSYKYFYFDGYGKDFSILNVQSNNISDDKFFEYMFVANLLSFYEQLLIYEENKNLLHRYNIEKPLWILVGSTVSGKKIESDIVKIASLFNKIFNDENWFKDICKKIINDKTELIDINGSSIFQDKYTYLKERINFDDLFKKVFNGRGAILFNELKNAEGEIGIKSGENFYFGVISVGNVSELKKNLANAGIEVGQDVIGTSLFFDIKKENSKINVLIGAKKFIEGWDTWRVSSMGLLNIGTSEGPQIIQLFGRGVRLKGENYSLKRSLDNAQIKKLQTLNIFGMKADYLSKFLETIAHEEIEFEEINIPLKLKFKNEWKNLYVPVVSNEFDNKFIEEEVIKLKLDDKIHFAVDLLPKIEIYKSDEKRNKVEITEDIAKTAQTSRFKKHINLIDINKVFDELIQYKLEKGITNIVFTKDVLKEILLDSNYNLFIQTDIFEIKTYDDLVKLNEIAIIILKKYLQLYYNLNKRKLELQEIKYSNITENYLPAFNKIKERDIGYFYKAYVEKVEENIEFIKKLKELVKKGKELLEKENSVLPRINLSNSLYIPLLIKNKRIRKISPDFLVDSETTFLNTFKDYIQKNKDMLKDIKIFLLRNNPSNGIGFTLSFSKYYPDFIMWFKKGKKEIIAFIDPKGLEHSQLLEDEKIQFSNDIKKIEKKLNRKNTTLESFIITPTKYYDIIKSHTKPPSKNHFYKNNVLFYEDDNWCDKLVKKLLEKF